MLSPIFNDFTTWCILMAPQSLISFVEKNLVCGNDTFIYSFEIVHLMVFRVARLFYGRCQAILEVMAKLSYVSPTWSHVYRLSSSKGCRAQTPPGVPW